MKLTLHGLKNCDACRKAIKALEGAGHEVTFKDVRADGVTRKQVTEWAKAAGWEALLNTRSTTWRGLGDADKKNVDEKKAVALMTAQPTLIKRPVIEHQGAVYVGWSQTARAALTE